jgi:hypothetical protein
LLLVDGNKHSKNKSSVFVFSARPKGLGLNIKVLITALALLSAAPSTAQASVVNFSLTGPDPAYSFELDAAPVVDSSILGYSFEIAGYTFYIGKPGGGGFDGYFGAQLYSGPESHPIFTPGVYLLYDEFTKNVDTLTIALGAGPLPPAVPEPSTWAMMLVGLFGLAACRRKKIATAAA